MKTIIAGIILFFLQIGVALYYNQSVDLIYVAIAAGITFIYILYKFFTGKYQKDTKASV